MNNKKLGAPYQASKGRTTMGRRFCKHQKNTWQQNNTATLVRCSLHGVGEKQMKRTTERSNKSADPAQEAGESNVNKLLLMLLHTAHRLL